MASKAMRCKRELWRTIWELGGPRGALWEVAFTTSFGWIIPIARYRDVIYWMQNYAVGTLGVSYSAKMMSVDIAYERLCARALALIGDGR